METGRTDHIKGSSSFNPPQPSRRSFSNIIPINLVINTLEGHIQSVETIRNVRSKEENRIVTGIESAIFKD